MRRLFFLLASVSLLFIGCKQKDTQEPLIILNGDNPMTITLGSWWEDPGAIVEDNVDGSIPNTLVVTHNIDINGPTNGEGSTRLTGTYIVTYTAKDKSDNVATATRTVLVKNGAYQYATKYYQYVDPTNGSIVEPDTITVDISVDTRINNRIYFPKLGSKLNQTYPNTIRVYGDIVHRDSINITSQYFSFWEGGSRYLYVVKSVANQSVILDTIDPYIKVKYYLDKYIKAPSYNGPVLYWPLDTPIIPEAKWRLIDNDQVWDIYERF